MCPTDDEEGPPAARQAVRAGVRGVGRVARCQTTYADELRLAVASAEVPDPDTAASLDQVASSLGALQQRLRSVMFRLHPASLDAHGLPAAASKHAGASSVIVRVSPHAGGASGEVIDDGVGFDLGAPAPSGHHGVEISRSLAEAVGGWWTVISAPGSGTTVRFWLPG